MLCQLIRCPQCEQMNYATGDICAVCGATLPPPSELDDAIAYTVRPRPRWLLLSLVGAILLGLTELGYQEVYNRNVEPIVAASFIPNTANPISSRSSNQQGPNVPYKVTQTWTTPTGGLGKCILIEPRYARPKWLRLLGQQLSRETPAANFTLIQVFDNPQAAAIRANRLYGSTPAEEALEVKYHVAQYTKKNSSHLSALVAYFDGFGGVNQQTYRY